MNVGAVEGGHDSEEPAIQPITTIGLDTKARLWRDLYSPELTMITQLAANVFHRP
jgi:hypothetical protein